ncbi:MAG: hypothetical protein GAK40_01182 [Burkholderia plantarii]|nr:MAG: hypothetical protein GAK40_01182 [Burkholderia plantarii]
MRIQSTLFRQCGLIALALVTAVLAACGGGGDGGGTSTAASTGTSSGTSSTSGTSAAAVQIPITVAAGVANVINVPTVSVTVCAPGTSTCQTIDNVLLDTASYGLRLINTAASGVLGSLPTLTASSGGTLAECGTFVSSYTWGSVRTADVKLGTLTAGTLPVQIIGDLGTSNVPTACSNGGSASNTAAALGANGILGVGPSPYDCGATCVSSTTYSNYYGCPTSGTCAVTRVPLAQQVANPVPFFGSNNDGVVVTMNAPSGGTATGTLSIGIGTLPSSVTKLTTTSAGDLSGTFLSRTISTAFFDTGSKAYFFDDSALATCSSNTAFYCPSTTTSLSATLTGGSNSAQVSFSIGNAQTLFNTGGYALANVGGPFGSSSILDFGLPHFYGRSIYFGMDLRTVGGTQTPYVAL